MAISGGFNERIDEADMTEPVLRQPRAMHTPAPALVVDPDSETSRWCAEMLEPLGFAATYASTPHAALEHLHGQPPNLVILDFGFPEAWGSNLLRQIRNTAPETTVVVVAKAPDLRTAFEAGRDGAAVIVDKHGGIGELRGAIERLIPAISTKGAGAADPERAAFFARYERLFHQSEKMRRLERLIRRVAETKSTLLIQGEPGVGKELIARAVHYLSAAAPRPFSKMNCVSLPAELLESEIFGREEAAPSDQTPGKVGRLEQACGGTLLLEEISELPPSLQAKIARVLESGEFHRVNGRGLLIAEVRIIATTHQHLPSLVSAGSFREDLHRRIQEMSIVVPPLRERREEIEPLQTYFRDTFAQQFNRENPPLSRSTVDLLLGYGWPGNIEELENLMKRYVVMGDESQLRTELTARLRAVRAQPVPAAGVPAPISVLEATAAGGLRAIAKQAAQQAEKAAITRVLEDVQWNRAEAARRLRISYKTLLTKLAQAEFGRKLRARSGR
jgi:DNA-binding NtrC family response regulator